MIPHEPWRAEARCVGLTESFFPDPRIPTSYRARTVAEAKAVCARCPVIESCLDYALEHRIRFGVWGGLSEEERESLERARRRRAG